MRHILATITMPNVNTWNGSWSGAGKFFGKKIGIKESDVVEFEETTGLKLNIGESKSWYYNFGDGWGASVLFEVMEASEISKLMRKSQGFMGYDWMVNSIVRNGKITTD